jgi:hypothetical protein
MNINYITSEDLVISVKLIKILRYISEEKYERKEDIPPLAALLLQRLCDAHSSNVTGLSPEALKAFVNYRCPGNVREMESAGARRRASHGRSSRASIGGTRPGGPAGSSTWRSAASAAPCPAARPRSFVNRKSKLEEMT